jgi:hypothetical protein
MMFTIDLLLSRWQSLFNHEKIYFVLNDIYLQLQKNYFYAHVFIVSIF